MEFPDGFNKFLVRAKKATYASGAAPASGSRPSSHDLTYLDGDFFYMDSYLGGVHFIGEEAVWLRGENIWGMNYYGKMLINEFPEGFSQFLKDALLEVDEGLPTRGPQVYTRDGFTYRCVPSGDLDFFEGSEDIFFGDHHIYHLVFHGGGLVN